MIKCTECAKEFKTQQGLVGHLRFVHGIKSNPQEPLFPPKRFITDEQLVEAITAISARVTNLNESVNVNASANAALSVQCAAKLAQLDKLVIALLIIHFMPPGTGEISLESLPAYIQSEIKSALASSH